jgi:hypothetical protein
VEIPDQEGWVPMSQQIEARLKELRSEYGKGQTQLRQLETQLTSVRETLIAHQGHHHGSGRGPGIPIFDDHY